MLHEESFIQLMRRGQQETLVEFSCIVLLSFVSKLLWDSVCMVQRSKHVVIYEVLNLQAHTEESRCGKSDIEVQHAYIAPHFLVW